ncbi:MAG: hypothetical protein ACI89X_000055 [Planctomycetota bacterium]|jgi:hypothetical protein
MIRDSAHVLFASLALLSSDRIAAQEPEKEPGPKMPLISIRAEGVQELVKAWPNTKLGKLMADEDVVDAAASTLNYTKLYLTRRQAVRDSFAQLDLFDEMDPYEVASLYAVGDNDLWRLFRFPIEEVTRAELTVRATDDLRSKAPSFATFLSCSPRYEGRWTQAFEQEAQRHRTSQLYKEVPGTKIDGFPAYSFKAPESVTGNKFGFGGAYERWMMHMPGTFVYGSGKTNSDATQAKQSDEAAISMELDLQTYLSLFRRMGVGIPKEFSTLGFDKLKTLKWSGRFRGELIEDKLEVQLTDKPGGLVGALLTGTGKLPAQALPKGAIAQLRSSVNLEMIAALLPALTNGLDLPEKVIKQVMKALDGGIAVSCCAPAPGGFIPRMYLSLGIADETALDGLFKTFLTDSLPTKTVTYSGIECTVLKFPDMPNGIQPAYCRINGILHLAESALSLRAFLKVQDEDTVAMDGGDAPEPGGIGELLPSFDWRFDEAQLYRCFYRDWLPLYEIGGLASAAPIRRKDLPEPDVVEMYCGKSRGVLRKDGDKYSLVMLGALGGPELAALTMTWGPMLVDKMGDYQTDQLMHRLARHKLEAVHTSLEKFQKREKRLPKDLAEWFTAEKLADDAMLLPADDLAETFTLPDGRNLKSSFRYFNEPVRFQTSTGEGGKTILIEIRTKSYNRITMTTKGVVPNAYGPDNQKPIDQFGKGGSGASSAPAAAGHNHK